MSTLIESLIRRAKGTRVTMGNTNYHFKPSANDERHTAEVSNEAHVDRFLAIPEGYREAERLAEPDETTGITAATSQPQPPEPEKPAAPANTIGPVDETGTGEQTPPAGDTPQGEQSQGAPDPATAGSTVLGDVTPPEVKEVAKPDGEAKKADQTNPEQAKEDATKAYIAKFGKKPHHAWTTEVILAKIAEG